MTQEEKELLLKDLCARLPYGVMCVFSEPPYGEITELLEVGGLRAFIEDKWKVKPYLKPMSSMTKDEMAEYKWLNDECDKMPTVDYIPVEYYRLFDWLNRHHFDYRNLIEKNLALDCTGLHIYD